MQAEEEGSKAIKYMARKAKQSKQKKKVTNQFVAHRQKEVVTVKPVRSWSR